MAFEPDLVGQQQTVGQEQVGQTEVGPEPGPVTQAESAEAVEPIVGKPDSVWRDARQLRALKAQVEERGGNWDMMREAISQIPQGGFTAPPQQQYAPPDAIPAPNTGDLDEYGQGLLQKVGQILPGIFAPYQQQLTQLQKKLDEFESLQASSEVDKGITELSRKFPLLTNPIMQEAVRNAYLADPNADLGEVAARYNQFGKQLLQEQLREAKMRTASPAPTLQAITPQQNIPELPGNSAKEQWDNMAARIKQSTAAGDQVGQ